MLLSALSLLRQPTRVLELGCGAGVDTLEMLRQGHLVEAVDASVESVRITRERVAAAGLAEQLTLRHESFETLSVEPGAYGLIFARFSLPFCEPDSFGAFWRQLEGGLAPGGLASFQLFGANDAWATQADGPPLTFHTAAEVGARLSRLTVRSLKEEEGVKPMACGGDKYWHIFHVLAALE